MEFKREEYLNKLLYRFYTFPTFLAMEKYTFPKNSIP